MTCSASPKNIGAVVSYHAAIYKAADEIASLFQTALSIDSSAF
jgi:hypothetical protein